MKKHLAALPIFSGPRSVKMWDEINNARTLGQLRDALYTICCHLQEFEGRLLNHLSSEPSHIKK
jgi:hypothetical protein